jgi:hypothetical protein
LKNNQNDKHFIQTLYKSIELYIAILLLTRQIFIRSIFISKGGSFGLSLSGPIFGDTRTEAIQGAPSANFVLDAVDIITALLLIIDQINVTSVVISGSRFSIIVGGPPFGGEKIVAYSPNAQKFFMEYRGYLFQQFQI